MSGEDGSPQYVEAKQQATRLQDHLETIFFEWDLVSGEARSKLVF